MGTSGACGIQLLDCVAGIGLAIGGSSYKELEGDR